MRKGFQMVNLATKNDGPWFGFEGCECNGCPLSVPALYGPPVECSTPQPPGNDTGIVNEWDTLQLSSHSTLLSYAGDRSCLPCTKYPPPSPPGPSTVQ